MEKLLNELVERMKRAHGDDLVSVLLYGSAASGDYHATFSDLNVLCVFRTITSEHLAAAGPIVSWWREKDNPAPLMMTEDELRNSADCFPIELFDMKEQSRVLFGENPVAGIDVPIHDYRAEVEHELRAKLLRLRHKAAGVMQDRQLLLRLMADSVATFCVLFRHALALFGESRRARQREIIDLAREQFEIDPEPFLKLLDLRDGHAKAREIDGASLLDSYMRQVDKVITAVNDLEGEKKP